VVRRVAKRRVFKENKCTLYPFYGGKCIA